MNMTRYINVFKYVGFRKACGSCRVALGGLSLPKSHVMGESRGSHRGWKAACRESFVLQPLLWRFALRRGQEAKLNLKTKTTMVAWLQSTQCESVPRCDPF